MSNSYKYIDPDYTYTDSNTGLLRNLQDITDPDVLLFVESSAVTKRLQELYQNPIKNKGIDNLFEIHRHLFQDIYILAGKKRIVEISKDDKQFFPTSHFDNAFRYIDQLIAEFKKIPKESKMSLAAYGKVDSIYNDITDLAINFDYDASQNRLSKRVITTASSDTVTSYYIRDAQGNIMAIYELRDDTVRWIEQDLYGSSRLGVLNPDSVVYPPTTYSQFFHHLQGKKQYELTNHLGNVLTTINDRKIGQDTATGDGLYDYWVAAQISGQDYYSGGMVMPERSFSYENYGFGYQGSLKNDDIKGFGNSYTTFFRENDPRLTRWWSIDPLFRKTPAQSPYISMGNNPILYCDKLGNLFGIEGLGSNKVQRQNAREIANRHQGQINGVLSKNINVTYSGYSNNLDQEPEKQNFTAEFYSDGSSSTIGLPSQIQPGPADPYTDMRRSIMQNTTTEHNLSAFDKFDRMMKMKGPDPYEGSGGFNHALPLMGKTALTIGTLGYFAEGYAAMSIFSRILGYSAITLSVDNLTKSSSGTILEQGANEIAGAQGVQSLNGLRTTVDLLSLANSGRAVFQTTSTGSFPLTELGAFGIDYTSFIMSTQEFKESLEKK